MLMPKKYKWRKHQRGVVRGCSKAGNDINFGEYGLVAMSSAFVTSREIESVRVAISRELKREGNLWIRIFPHKPITKRPAETRMGKGKGDLDHYVAVVQQGRVMFEIAGVAGERAIKALKRASYKLSMATMVIKKGVL